HAERRLDRVPRQGGLRPGLRPGPPHPGAEGPPLRRADPRPRRSQAGRAADLRPRPADPDRPGQGLPVLRSSAGARPRRRGLAAMAGRVPVAALALAAALALGAAPATVLVRYGFDDDALDTGPDTFAVFRAAHGRVGLSSAFRVSGYRSVEISDVHGNGDFSELQGYFPE